MPAPEPRPYQHELVGRTRDALRRVRSVVIQSPTGSGKSVLIAYMIARAAERNKGSWLICHRKELVKQLSEDLWAAGVQHGVIASGRTMTKDPVQVASVQTLVNRLDMLPPPDLLAIDECHHAAAATYLKIIDACASSRIVGLSATPVRTDGRGLDDIFQAIVPGPSVKELTDMGYLSPYRIFAPNTKPDLTGIRKSGGDWARGALSAAVDQKHIVGDAVDHYLKLVAPGTCLVYCVTRAHARHVEAAYRARGVNARYCAGDTPKEERERLVEGLKNGTQPVLVSVDLFGEGLNCPGLTAVQMLRPTQSLTLYLQMVGRALRPEKGKSHAIILDHVHNCMTHGLPDDDREWSLEGRKKRAKGSDGSVPALQHCEECFAIYAKGGPCPLCGWMPDTKKGRLPEHVDGELQEVDKAALRAQRVSEEREAFGRGFEAVVELAMERGYKFGWAARRWSMRGRQDINEWFKEERRVRSERKAAT